MAQLRFQAPGKQVYNRTVSNQIGPDVTGVATKRTLPTFTNSNTIYVAKYGNDSNAGTTSAPKLTIQAAVTAAVSISFPYVVINDSGTYEEIIDGKKVSIYAAANCHPIIKYPAAQAATEAYSADSGVITLFNNYGTNEYALRGWGTHFTGTINDYQIIDGVHWIASTNGIWYSYLGYTGWYQVSGTAGSNFKHLVASNGGLYVVKTGTGIYRVTKTGISLEVTDANVLSLAGNDNHLAAVTNVSSKMNIWHLTTQGWVLTDVSVKSSLYYTAITGFNKMFQVDNDYYLFVHVKDSDALYYGGSYIKIPALTETATAPSKVWVNTWSSWGYGTTNVATVYDFIQDNSKKLLYVASTTIEGATLHSFDYAVITAPTYRNVTTPASYTRLWADPAGTGQYYLGYVGGLYRTTDWTAFFTVVTTTGQTPVAIFDADPGRIILGNTWTAGGVVPALYIWKKFSVYNAQKLEGITLDGNNLGQVGLYCSYANGEHGVAKYCTFKNYTLSGIMDGGIGGQRSHVANCIMTDNGIGFKVPDFVDSLPRLYYCFVHGNEYGIYAVGYSNIFGPELHNNVITDNSVVGVWYQGLGDVFNPVVLNVYSNIIYGNGFDFILKNRSVATAMNTIYNNVLGTFDFDANVNNYAYTHADPLLLSNGDYQDIEGGYPFDSVAKSISAGLYLITRTGSPVAGLDYRFGYLPETKSVSWKPSNFQSNENAFGEYSESWDGLKRTIVLSWPDNYFSTREEFCQFIDLIRQEDAVLRFGESSGNDALYSGWAPLYYKSGGVSGSGSSKTLYLPIESGHEVAVNEFSGYVCEITNVAAEVFQTRIVSHPAGKAGETIEVVVADGLSDDVDNSDFAILYLLVKIDKSSAFSGSQFGFPLGVNPMTGYSLTLREVEHE